MEIRESKAGDFVILEPMGRLDTKSSPDLEKKVLELLAAGQRRFVVDFGGVEFLSSAGLRVLLMLAKKLAGGNGYLALSALNERVREVFDIAGFTSVFTIRATAGDAVGSAPAAGAAGERAAEDAARALGVSGD
ncbi:MAG TPA: STAS domain-containing protein, partial [Thermoanaerobaculia bacterium]|nr:STAS domain-containing protein [Thermoanaerobaculia bacterium]